MSIFFKLDFEDIMLIILPLFHSGGLFIQASPTLYKGATMIIHPRFDPARTYRDIEYYRVTKLLGVPTIYRALLEVENEKRQDIKGLKISAIGGEKTTPELLLQCKNAGFPLRQIMGQTETSILLWASEKDLLLKPGTVGKPVFHAEVAVVDKNSRQVSPGEIGEIVVRGSIMMQEYWRDPIKTEQTIRNGWLHTEDLASIDEDGYFFLAARATEMYISGGENVYTAEVEQILQEHSHIKEAAVTGVQDKEWGEVGHAFLILKKDVELDTGEIYSFLQGKIAHFKYPKKFTFCEDFPRTFLGKVRKGALIGSE
jgi:fatty-acyl-CoA synthase